MTMKINTGTSDIPMICADDASAMRNLRPASEKIFGQQTWLLEVKKRKEARMGLSVYDKLFIPRQIRNEMVGNARHLGLEYFDLLLMNLTYELAMGSIGLESIKGIQDVLSLLRRVGWKAEPAGCTSFAAETGEHPIHGRNLDWPDPAHALRDGAVMVEYPAKDGRNHFVNVTWPGYSGVLTGMVPGKFSVAINACWCDCVGIGIAPTHLLRRALEKAASYEKAVKMISEIQLFAGALFTVVGARSGQSVIIEREPLRYAWRKGDYVVTTNDYVSLHPKTVQSKGSEILETSCKRYQAVQEFLDGRKDVSAQDSMEILRSERVMMGCTVQHVVVEPATGTITALRAS